MNASPSNEFYVVAIGLSAGGLDPLREIVSELPENLNAAVVVIQHFPEGRQSALANILQRQTALELVEVVAPVKLAPGKVYVMPHGGEFLLEKDMLSLIPRSEDSRLNRTITNFFLLLAKETGSRAIGIILSGAGYDGLEGAIAIENKHGVMIVQDPVTAKFPLMPATLIANDHPDYVLTPWEIREKIMKLTSCRNAPL